MKCALILFILVLCSCNDSTTMSNELRVQKAKVKNTQSLLDFVDIENSSMLKNIKTNSDKNSPIIDKQLFELLSKELENIEDFKIKKDQLVVDTKYFEENNTPPESYILYSSKATFVFANRIICSELIDSDRCIIIKTKNNSFIINSQHNNACVTYFYDAVKQKHGRATDLRCTDYNQKLSDLIFNKIEQKKNEPNYKNMNDLKKDLSYIVDFKAKRKIC